jgi:hypothetical protein
LIGKTICYNKSCQFSVSGEETEKVLRDLFEESLIDLEGHDFMAICCENICCFLNSSLISFAGLGDIHALKVGNSQLPFRLVYFIRKRQCDKAIMSRNRTIVSLIPKESSHDRSKIVHISGHRAYHHLQILKPFN